MDKKRQLQKSQLKLTVLFTLLVFWIASILQLSFFSYKYYSWIYQETQKMDLLTYVIQKNNIPLTQIHNLIKNEKRIWEPIKKWETQAELPGWKIMNFALLDSQNYVFVQSIRGEVDLQKVAEVIENKPKNTQLIGSMLIKYTPLQRSIETYQLVLFKELNYSFQNYASDIFKFFILISIFSILVFVIGYYFVRVSLKPVEENITEMDDFVHNAGHELKTPISVVSSNLQLMKQLKQTDNIQMIEENIAELSHMDKLIEALVRFTDLSENTKISHNSIWEIVDTIQKDFEWLLQEKNIIIMMKKTNDFNIKSNRELLYILISNIIKNAIKFSHNDSELHISYADKKIIIQDFWIGIQKENIPKIFWRFYRQNNARNKEWFGIWLALVAKIAKMYKWKIKVDSQENQWTKFIINF